MTRHSVQLLAFGFLLTFLSGFGQTFFIGLFSDDLRAATGLGTGSFGTLYSAATLASAATIFWAGTMRDRTPPDAAPKDASRGQVLRDRRFHMLLPTLLLPGFVVTGVLIHQAALVADKGWTASWFAGAIAAFAAGQVTGMLGSGPLVDRITARRLVPFYLLPLAAACVAATLTDARWIALPFMLGMGITSGASGAVSTALWAELYGLTHLGAIRALAASTMVLSTALAPVIFGWLIEAGVAFDALLLGCAVAAVGALVLAGAAVTTPDAAPKQQ